MNGGSVDRSTSMSTNPTPSYDTLIEPETSALSHRSKRGLDETTALAQPSSTHPSTTPSTTPSSNPGLLGIFSGNPYFSAGFGLLGLTALAGLSKQGLTRLIDYSKRRFLLSVEVSSRDISYPWILNFLAGLKAKGTGANLVSLQTSLKSAASTKGGSAPLQKDLVPGVGYHWIQYKGKWFKIDRTRERGSMVSSGGGGGGGMMNPMGSMMPLELLTITTLANCRPQLWEMINQAESLASSREENRTTVYTSRGPEWRPFGDPRRKRPFDSVVLAKNIAEQVKSDVEQFLSSDQWYYERGIPYRRGYLFYGPPGSGKTSFINALAGSLNYNICVMNMSERGMTDDRLAYLLQNVPPKSFLLLEDVDAAFVQRNKAEGQTGGEGYGSMLTFSGLLNALDGIASSEERLVFMTTNHLDRLDPALIRPGRVDVQVEVDDVSAEQAERLFKRFYPHVTEVQVEKFLKGIGIDRGNKISAAALQGHFVTWKFDLEEAIQNAPLLCPK